MHETFRYSIVCHRCTCSYIVCSNEFVDALNEKRFARLQNNACIIYANNAKVIVVYEKYCASWWLSTSVFLHLVCFHPYHYLVSSFGVFVCSFSNQFVLFVKRRVLFGTVPLFVTSTQTVHIENLGDCHAYFKVCLFKLQCITG